MANGDFALVCYYQYARCPLVEFVGSTRGESYNTDIQKGNSTLEIKSDHGPPFKSQKNARGGF